MEGKKYPIYIPTGITYDHTKFNACEVRQSISKKRLYKEIGLFLENNPILQLFFCFSKMYFLLYLFGNWLNQNSLKKESDAIFATLSDTLKRVIRSLKKISTFTQVVWCSTFVLVLIAIRLKWATGG